MNKNTAKCSFIRFVIENLAVLIFVLIIFWTCSVY